VSQAYSSPSTSFTLLQRVRALDPEAWHALSRLYGPLVYRWARQSGLQPQDASDVAQNVFVSILRGISRFSLEGPEATFRGWLWTITRNAVREFARRQSRHPAAAGGSDAQHTLLELPGMAPKGDWFSRLRARWEHGTAGGETGSGNASKPRAD